MRALIGATLKHGDDALSFRYALASVGSEKMRIDVLPLEGAMTLGLLVIRDGNATLLDTQRREATVESDPDALLEELIGLRGLTTQNVVGLVSARMPTLRCESVAVYPTPNDQLIVVEKNSHSAWYVDARTRRVSRLQVLDEDDAEVLLEALISPRLDAIDLKVYSPLSAEGELTIERLVEDPVISDSVFNVSVPASYTVRDGR